MDLEVVIEGVSDVHLAREIKRTIRRVCEDADFLGEWSVLMSPSETRGHWDLDVRGPAGHHCASFAERAGELPAFVEQHLQVCLRRTTGIPDESAGPNRTAAGAS
jgi:hypothetical protein